jgi:hypothetical protein
MMEDAKLDVLDCYEEFQLENDVAVYSYCISVVLLHTVV